MTANRQVNGQFGPDNNANRKGRPRKTGLLSDEIRRELAAKVDITENGTRKRVSKLSASAKQIANQGASGNLRAAKLAMDLAHRTDNDREGVPAAVGLTASDSEIVRRFIARLKATDLLEDQSDVDA